MPPVLRGDEYIYFTKHRWRHSQRRKKANLQSKTGKLNQESGTLKLETPEQENRTETEAWLYSVRILFNHPNYKLKDE